MKRVVQHIALRLLAVSLLLVGMNFIYTHFFYEDDLQEYAPIVNALREIPDDARILYIGESSNLTTSPEDLDQRSIGDFMSEYFPHLKVGQITQPAAHAGTFKAYLEAIDPKKKIETVVVTLNLRSFNAEWIHSGLETPLRKGTLMLQDGPKLWNRFLLAFRSYPVSTEKERFALVNEVWKAEALQLDPSFPYKTTFEWKDALEKQEEGAEAHSDAHTRLQLAKEFVCSYAFRIDTLNNPRIADLNAIIALAKARNWNLVFNLMGENVDQAQALCGNELVGIMRDNRDLLINYFSRRGVLVVDQLETVRDAEFVDRDWPTEHYNQSGRKRIAENLANALVSRYPLEYQEPQKAHFHNDFEGSLPWQNLHTLSTEKAASGAYSSKINANWPYSAFFRSTFADIPVNARNKVTIHAMVHSTAYDERAMLAVDLELDSGTQFWKAVPLKDLTKGKKGWQKISCTFDLSSAAKEGKVIKIYVHNPSEKVMFVDDFDILFHE